MYVGQHKLEKDFFYQFLLNRQIRTDQNPDSQIYNVIRNDQLSGQITVLRIGKRIVRENS